MKSIMNCTHTPIITHIQAVRTLFLEHVIYFTQGKCSLAPSLTGPHNNYVVLFEIKGLTPTNPGSSGVKGIGSKQSLHNFNYMLQRAI